jgi:hypothetical protein
VPDVVVGQQRTDTSVGRRRTRPCRRRRRTGARSRPARGRWRSGPRPASHGTSSDPWPGAGRLVPPMSTASPSWASAVASLAWCGRGERPPPRRQLPHIGPRRRLELFRHAGRASANAEDVTRRPESSSYQRVVTDWPARLRPLPNAAPRSFMDTDTTVAPPGRVISSSAIVSVLSFSRRFRSHRASGPVADRS